MENLSRNAKPNQEGVTKKLEGELKSVSSYPSYGYQCDFVFEYRFIIIQI